MTSELGLEMFSTWLVHINSWKDVFVNTSYLEVMLDDIRQRFDNVNNHQLVGTVGFK